MNTKSLKDQIKDLRKKQVLIQNKIQKQEENNVYDESLYLELDKLDEQIHELENKIYPVEYYTPLDNF